MYKSAAPHPEKFLWRNKKKKKKKKKIKKIIFQNKKFIYPIFIHLYFFIFFPNIRINLPRLSTHYYTGKSRP